MPRSEPNYLTTLPNGDISALFSGGIQILAGTDASPPDSRQVRWVEETGGALVAQILAYDFIFGGTNHSLSSEWILNNPIGGAGHLGQALIGLFGEDPQGGLNWRVLAQAQSNAGGAASATVIDSAEQSSFLQLISTRRLRVEVGRATIVWNGTALSNITAINHNLNAIPVCGLLTLQDVGQVANVFLAPPQTANQAGVQARAVGAVGAGGTSQVEYALFG